MSTPKRGEINPLALGVGQRQVEPLCDGGVAIAASRVATALGEDGNAVVPIGHSCADARGGRGDGGRWGQGRKGGHWGYLRLVVAVSPIDTSVMRPRIDAG